MSAHSSFGLLVFRAILRLLPFLRHGPDDQYPCIRLSVPVWFRRRYCERLEGEIQIIDGVHSWKPGQVLPCVVWFRCQWMEAWTNNDGTRCYFLRFEHERKAIPLRRGWGAVVSTADPRCTRHRWKPGAA